MFFSDKILELSQKAEEALAPVFKNIDAKSTENTARVMDTFAKYKVSDSLFAGTSGYGYDDRGRDTLDLIYADLFGADAAFVRHNIVSGTHALTIALFGILRPGDILLSVTGKPYDTLDEVIGSNTKNGDGSLADFGVEYREVAMTPDSKVDFPAVKKAIDECGSKLKAVFFQRSKGYLNRRTLTTSEMKELIDFVRSNTNAYIIADNCYGEFVDVCEPSSYGADLVVGSLIKNPGGGIAESGGYIAGSKKAVELASYRLTSVGVGCEVGATLGQNKSLYKGLFYAPHTVAQALKTAHFAAYIFDALGYEVEPSPFEERADIIQAVKLNAPELLCAFCRGIQYGSPVDSFVTPEPWDMPGYNDQVIMAAGTFVQGASIELSADGPMRPPYTVFFQGGLTYESGKIGIMSAAEELLKEINKK